MNLQKITKHIILDVSVSRYVSVLVKQYDINVREIIVKVTNNGKPYPISNKIKPRIKCKKDDGTLVFNDCTVLEDGNIKIDVTDQMTACVGTHECEIALFDTTKSDEDEKAVLHTMDFVLIVKGAVFSDNEVTSSNEFIALENALLEIGKIEQIKRITESQIDSLFG